MTYEGDSHFDVGRMQSNLFATLQQLLFFYDILSCRSFNRIISRSACVYVYTDVQYTVSTV